LKLRTRGNLIVMDKERADAIRPILRWIKSAAPRKIDRKDAADMLREMEGLQGWKQLVLTTRELQMLDFIYKEYPEVINPVKEKQLELPLEGL